jgi:hypothetical protein
MLNKRELTQTLGQPPGNHWSRHVSGEPVRKNEVRVASPDSAFTGPNSSRSVPANGLGIFKIAYLLRHC